MPIGFVTNDMNVLALLRFAHKASRCHFCVFASSGRLRPRDWLAGDADCRGKGASLCRVL